MSRDTLYQSVRGHLAYLKLAAAEALPVELDTAMKGQRTHTEFLDRLLSTEVQAVEARRHAGLLRFANFPAPWRLNDFDFTARPSVDQALVRDLATCPLRGRRHQRPVHRAAGANPSVEAASSYLVDTCSRHDIPPAVPATSPTSKGTI